VGVWHPGGAGGAGVARDAGVASCCFAHALNACIGYVSRTRGQTRHHLQSVDDGVLGEQQGYESDFRLEVAGCQQQ
jgi:hypothetical protein